MAKPLDLTGKRFTKLTAKYRNGSTKASKAIWKCSCDCGGFIDAITSSLMSGKTTSCGCDRYDHCLKDGILKRTIHYNNISCSRCGKNQSHRFIRSDGSIIEHLTEARIHNITCKSCILNIAIENGRIISLKNDHIILTQTQIDVVVGSILGDGHLEQSPSPGDFAHWSLAVKHGLIQKEYCLWKAKLLSTIISNIDYPVDRIRFRTIKCQAISTLVNPFLKNGKKRITTKGIQNMGPLAFAIWYMDDGNLLPYRTSKNGQIRKPEIRFATNAFNEKENLILRNILEQKVDIKTTRCTWVSKRTFGGKLLKIPKIYYGIRLYGENAEKFLEFIRSHVNLKESGMSYKFNLTMRGPLDNKHTRRRLD